ncbi:hypothetical protein [Cytobacillus kochii]
MSFNEGYKEEVDLPVQIIESIDSWMNYINGEVVAGNIAINNDLTLKSTGDYELVIEAEPEINAKGKNKFEVLW